MKREREKQSGGSDIGGGVLSHGYTEEILRGDTETVTELFHASQGY